MFKIILVVAMLSGNVYYEAEIESTEPYYKSLTECKEVKAKAIENMKRMEHFHRIVSEGCVKIPEEETEIRI